MRKTIAYYVFGTLALAGALSFAAMLSPDYGAQGSTTVAAFDFWRASIGADLVELVGAPIPEGRGSVFYSRLVEKIDKRSKIGVIGSASRQKREERLATANRLLLFCADAPYWRRFQAQREYSRFLLDKGDVVGLTALRKEIEEIDWKNWEAPKWQDWHDEPEANAANLAFFARAYQIQAEIAEAIEKKDDAKLEDLVPELETLAMEDRDYDGEPVHQRVAEYVGPIARYDRELGNKAKIAMRRGFYRVSRRLNDKLFRTVYPPKIATIPVDGTSFSYDETLLDVPRDETTFFYKTRLADLQTLLARVPVDSSDAAETLRAKIQNALADVYENYPLAVDLLPYTPWLDSVRYAGLRSAGHSAAPPALPDYAWRPLVDPSTLPNPNAKPSRALTLEDPDEILKTSCEKLAELGAVERLERIAERDDYRDVVESYLVQARATRATETGESADVDAAIDAAILWALTEPDDVLVVSRIKSLLAELEKNDDGPRKLETAKAKFRDSFSNSENPVKKRLAKLPAFQ